MSTLPGINTAILDFCTRLDNGPRVDASAAPPRPVRDPEDYKFLRLAMEHMEYPEKTLKKLLDFANKTFASSHPNQSAATSESIDGVPKEEVERQLKECLEQIDELVEDLNLAVEYRLMQGPQATLTWLRSRWTAEQPTLRSLCARIVAHSSQNDSDVIAAFEGWEKVLLPILTHETDFAARADFLLALGSLCRGNDASTGTFLLNDGLLVVERIVERIRGDAEHHHGCVTDEGAAVGSSGHNGTMASTRPPRDARSLRRAVKLLSYFVEAVGVATSSVLTVLCALLLDDDIEVSAAAAKAIHSALERCGRDANTPPTLLGMLVERTGAYCRTMGIAGQGVVLPGAAAAAMSTPWQEEVATDEDHRRLAETLAAIGRRSSR